MAPKSFSFALHLPELSIQCYGQCKSTYFYTYLHPMTLSLSQFSRTPKNARSKRAMDARQPKEIEDPRTAIFVKGTHTGEVLNGAMKELVRHIYPSSNLIISYDTVDGSQTTQRNLLL